MKFGMYSIRDVKTGFMTPTIQANDDVAVRDFTHAVVNSDGVLSSFCTDFSLCKIGEFDSDSGVITPAPVPQLIIDGAAAIRSFRGGVLDD